MKMAYIPAHLIKMAIDQLKSDSALLAGYSQLHLTKAMAEQDNADERASRLGKAERNESQVMAIEDVLIAFRTDGVGEEYLNGPTEGDEIAEDAIHMGEASDPVCCWKCNVEPAIRHYMIEEPAGAEAYQQGSSVKCPSCETEMWGESRNEALVHWNRANRPRQRITPPLRAVQSATALLNIATELERQRLKYAPHIPAGEGAIEVAGHRVTAIDIISLARLALPNAKLKSR